jgi:hypothetical protein
VPEAPKSVKIAFQDADNDVETLWAIDLGDGRYELDNSPWYQYGVSWKDIVAAEPAADGFLEFTRVIEKRGHRTVRMRADRPIPQSFLDSIVAFGCSYEGAIPTYMAIDIPPGIDFDGAVRLLLESGLEWEHGDPTYEQLHTGA